MVGERERATGVEADHLEDAVAAIEAVVRQWEDGFPGGRHRSIDACQFSYSHGATLVHATARPRVNRRLKPTGHVDGRTGARIVGTRYVRAHNDRGDSSISGMNRPVSQGRHRIAQDGLNQID